MAAKVSSIVKPGMFARRVPESALLTEDSG